MRCSRLGRHLVKIRYSPSVEGAEVKLLLLGARFGNQERSRD
jgi:hypothetical protein